MKTLLPSIFNIVYDRTIPVKMAAERALYRILKLKEGNEGYTHFLEGLSPSESKSIRDYTDRVLIHIEMDE